MNIKIGPQEPPQDSIVFNRRQADGTFPPLSEFFNGAIINNLKSRKSRIIEELKKGEIIPGSEIAMELYRELIEIEDELEKIE